MKAAIGRQATARSVIFPIDVFVYREPPVIRITFLIAIMATTVSMTAENSDAQLFRRGGNSCCVQQRMCRPRCCRPARQPVCCQRTMPGCCSPVASSCCGCSRGCGCISGCNSGCGCDGGSIVVNPVDPNNPDDDGIFDPDAPQDCARNHARCTQTCSGCSGQQYTDCMAYCQCVLERCNNPSLPPCTVPACGGPNATGN